jgi:hypothetical protein
MAYAQTYVINETGSDMEVYIGISSDDSIQVLMNGQEVWIHSIGRGGQDACTGPQDITPDGVLFTDPVILAPGENNLILKVFNGTVDWDFVIRFQDAMGTPITEGLKIATSVGGQGGPTFHRGDADQNEALELTDAIQILGYLFLGSPTKVPDCEDAADADDNGVIELTDAIRVLGYLFLGTATIPDPGPPESPCGEDPTLDDALGCPNYAPCGPGG